MRDVGYRGRNMPATENVQHRLRQNRLHENLQRAAADQAGVVLGVVIQIEGHFARLFGDDHFFRCGPDFGFYAASADGPHDGTIVAHQHARAFVARDRAVGVDDRRERASLAGLAHPYYFFKYVHFRVFFGWPSLVAEPFICSR